MTALDLCWKKLEITRYNNVNKYCIFSLELLRAELGHISTLDFSSLLKNHFECSFVSSECSLQSSNVCFEVRSEYLR